MTPTVLTDLLVGLVDPGPVGALELERDVLLLDGDQLLVARLHVLRSLLVLDGVQAPETMKQMYSGDWLQCNRL